MENERETKRKLLESARAEFIEKGYMKASLRNICKGAGVTTGALYFFFKDKEDLFGQVVAGPLHELEEVMLSHFRGELENADTLEPDDGADDYEVTRQIIHTLFRYYEEFTLLLTKAQDSGYEQITDKIVAVLEKHYRMLVGRMREAAGKERVEDFMIHWISHSQVDAFVHLLTHCSTEEEALKQMDGLVDYLRGGFFAVT